MFKMIRFHTVSLMAILTVLAIGCAPVHDETTLASGGSNGDLIVDETLQTEALNIIQMQCSGCHGALGSGGVSNITDVDHLISTGLIVPGDPSQGALLGSIEDGSMPLGAGSIPGLPQADVDTISDWISSMQVSSDSSEEGMAKADDLSAYY